MRRILRLLLLTCGGLLALVPSAAAQLNQDWQSGDDGGALKCYECILDRCDTALEGHQGKHKCSTTCDITGCSCATSGAICTGGSARIWIVPNGEGLTPALQQPPIGALEALLPACA